MRGKKYANAPKFSTDSESKIRHNPLWKDTRYGTVPNPEVTVTDKRAKPVTKNKIV